MTKGVTTANASVNRPKTPGPLTRVTKNVTRRRDDRAAIPRRLTDAALATVLESDPAPSVTSGHQPARAHQPVQEILDPGVGQHLLETEGPHGLKVGLHLGHELLHRLGELVFRRLNPRNH